MTLIGCDLHARMNHPARRISLRSASARLNSIRTTDHCSALHRVWSITRRTRLMRSQGLPEAHVRPSGKNGSGNVGRFVQPPRRGLP